MWAVSIDGNVYRYSAGSSQADRVAHLGADTGRSPFAIRRIPLDSKLPPRPFLLSLSPNAVVGLDLITNSPRTFYEVDSGNEILSRLDENWGGVEVFGSRIFLFQHGKSGVDLVAIEANSGKVDSFAVDEEAVSGPFLFDSEIAFHGKRKFYRLDAAGSLSSREFPRGFVAATRGDDLGNTAPFGRSAFLSTFRGVYLPGRARSGRLEILMLARNRRALRQNKVDLQGEATYALDQDGHLVVGEKGRIRVINETRTIKTHEYEDLTTRVAPFHDQGLAIGLARSQVKAESIAFIREGSHKTLPVSAIDKDFLQSEPVGFFRTSVLMMAYRLENGKMRIAQWKG